MDSTAPETTLTEQPAAITGGTEATFRFASEAGASFECRLDDGAFASCASPVTYPDLAAGGHTFAVRSVDAAGNADASPAVHTWTVDLTAPETTLADRPADLTNSANATFTFTSDDSGATFECALDDGPFAPCAAPVELTGLADGEHTFRVRATDAVGNADASPATHAWTVDSAAPAITLTDQPDSLSNSSSARFAFTASEEATIVCKLDDAVEFTACQSPATFADLADGAHVLEIRAVDQAGNAGAAARYAWTIDTAAPATTIDAQPNATSAAREATFEFSADEAGTTFECRLDDAAFATCTSPATYNALGDGAHTFAVRATDAAGNSDASPATHGWTVDTTAPQTAIDDGPAGRVAQTTATFVFSANEDATFACKLDDGAFSACASPHQMSNLDAGAHTFEVRSTDLAGNADGTPAIAEWIVDTVPPVVTIEAAPAATTASTDANFTFSADEPATFECPLDGAAFSACPSPIDYADLRWAATSSASAPPTARATAASWPATPGPSCRLIRRHRRTIARAPAATTTDTSASFTFSADEPSSFECRLDDAAFTTCTSPNGLTGLELGTHTFRVRATDADGQQQ